VVDPADRLHDGAAAAEVVRVAEKPVSQRLDLNGASPTARLQAREQAACRIGCIDDRSYDVRCAFACNYETNKDGTEAQGPKLTCGFLVRTNEGIPGVSQVGGRLEHQRFDVCDSHSG
jgi:hypothetical protein